MFVSPQKASQLTEAGGRLLRRLRRKVAGIRPDTSVDALVADYFRQDRLLNQSLLHAQLRYLFSELGINCVLDVGANTGQYGSELRGLGYSGHIISFEPVDEAFEELCERTAADPKWSAHAIALGSCNATSQINVMRRSIFSSFRQPSDYLNEMSGESAIIDRVQDVEVKRLDGLLGDLLAGFEGPRVFLKMDTQGHDLEVFEGLGSGDDRILGLQSEVSVIRQYEDISRLTEAIDRYEASGFEITGLYPVWRDRPSARVIEFDCVMVRST